MTREEIEKEADEYISELQEKHPNWDFGEVWATLVRQAYMEGLKQGSEPLEMLKRLPYLKDSHEAAKEEDRDIVPKEDFIPILARYGKHWELNWCWDEYCTAWFANPSPEECIKNAHEWCVSKGFIKT